MAKEDRLDKDTEVNFDLIATYFVQIFYVKFYDSAKAAKDKGEFSTITRGYTAKILKYAEYTKEADFFSNTVTGIHQYFNMYTSERLLYIEDCINKLSGSFIPQDFIDVIDNRRKKQVLRSVFIDLVKLVVHRLYEEKMLRLVLEDRCEATIELLRDQIFEFLVMQRKAIFIQFVKNRHRPKVDLNSELFKNLQGEVKGAATENEKLRELIQKARNIIAEKDEKIKNMKTLIDDLKIYIQKLTQLLNAKQQKSTGDSNNPQFDILGLTSSKPVKEPSNKMAEIFRKQKEKLEKKEKSKRKRVASESEHSSKHDSGHEPDNESEHASDHESEHESEHESDHESDHDHNELGNENEKNIIDNIVNLDENGDNLEQQFEKLLEA